jgi:hypothetical protein
MYTVSCVIASILLLIALVVSVYSLTLVAKENPRGKMMLTAGLLTAIAGIFLWAIIFGFGSI